MIWQLLAFPFAAEAFSVNEAVLDGLVGVHDETDLERRLAKDFFEADTTEDDDLLLQGLFDDDDTWDVEEDLDLSGLSPQRRASTRLRAKYKKRKTKTKYKKKKKKSWGPSPSPTKRKTKRPTPKPVPSPSNKPKAGVAHQGKYCWSKCGGKPGRCDYCGSRGACCKAGSSSGDGCDGQGSGSGHRCVKASGSVTPSPQPSPSGSRLDKACWSHCNKQPGMCSWCDGSGTSGKMACCKKGSSTGSGCNGKNGFSRTGHYCTVADKSSSGQGDGSREGKPCWSKCGSKPGLCDYCFVGQGVEGACCKLGSDSGDGCTGYNGKSSSGHYCTRAEYLPELMNQDKACASSCDGGARMSYNGGHCPNFCGTKGYCCKQLKTNGGNGCDGTNGFSRIAFTCTAPSYGGVVQQGLANLGRKCLDRCKNKPGKCDLCGQFGACCKQQDTTGEGCNGGNGGQGDFRCASSRKDRAQGDLTWDDAAREWFKTYGWDVGQNAVYYPTRNPGAPHAHIGIQGGKVDYVGLTNSGGNGAIYDFYKNGRVYTHPQAQPYGGIVDKIREAMRYLTFPGF